MYIQYIHMYVRTYVHMNIRTYEHYLLCWIEMCSQPVLPITWGLKKNRFNL